MLGKLLAVALAAAFVLLAVPLGQASPAGLDSHVLAAPRPGQYDYLTKVVVVDTAGTLSFTNLDLPLHDVVAIDHGPATNPWCARYEAGHCPLFASPLIGLGEQAEVVGIDQLEPLSTYTFFCTIHDWMKGTLVTI